MSCLTRLTNLSLTPLTRAAWWCSLAPTADRLYFPPRPASEICGEGESVVWKEVSGRGTIYNYCVVYDCPVASLKEDLPFNLAVIMLDEDPGILMYSHLPGVPPDEVPVGAAVRVIFEETANGQKVPEWVLVE